MLARTPLLVLPIACGTDETIKDTDDTGVTDSVVDTDTGTDTDTATNVQVADSDNDTIDAPLFTESFVGSGAPQEFTVADDISATPGDPEDWVAFTTPALENAEVNITFALTCTGSDTITVQLWDDDGPSPTALGASQTVKCATSPKTILLTTNHDYAARVYYANGADAGAYTSWELTVSW